MKHKVATTINGRKHEDEVESRLLLVHYIRDVAGLTGTHIGCDTSQCGACTILVDGKSVKSCTMFAVQAEGRNLMTIEGMAKDGELHPLQQAFWDEHGLQCGYCTPGFLMATAYLLEQNPTPTDAEGTSATLSGNVISEKVGAMLDRCMSLNRCSSMDARASSLTSRTARASSAKLLRESLGWMPSRAARSVAPSWVGGVSTCSSASSERKTGPIGGVVAIL